MIDDGWSDVCTFSRRVDVFGVWLYKFGSCASLAVKVLLVPGTLGVVLPLYLVVWTIIYVTVVLS